MAGLTPAESALFKAYDIRGAAPEPLSPPLAWRIGRAFAEQLGGGSIGLARDMRSTSPALAAAFAAGLGIGRAEVINYGMLPSDAMWFAVRHHRLDGGAVITASHNPPGDNGIKLVERDAAPLFAETGLPELRRRTARIAPPERGDLQRQAAPAKRGIADEYRAFLEGVVDFRRLPPLRVVLDAGNGMGGVMAEQVFPRVPGQFIPMFFEPDGSFPNRGPNPLDPANRRLLTARILEERADFGVLWDGDGDRCGLVDDRGGYLPADFTTALLAPQAIAREPGAKIVFDVRSSRAVPEAITRAGGTPCPERVGHTYLKRRMRQEDAPFGGELSGHFFFRETAYADNALLPILRMMERIGDAGRPLSELAGTLRSRYFPVDEMSLAVRDAAAALATVEEAFPGGECTRLDGLTTDFPDWRFTLRPSNTEPVLRLTVEAYRPGLAERRRDEIAALLRNA